MLINLKAAVLRSGLMQYEVARRSNLSETRFSRILMERTKATPAEKDVLARVLGVPLELSSALWESAEQRGVGAPPQKEATVPRAPVKESSPPLSLDDFKGAHPDVVTVIQSLLADADLKLRFILLRAASKRLGKEALTSEEKALNQFAAEELLLDLLESEIRKRRKHLDMRRNHPRLREHAR